MRVAVLLSVLLLAAAAQDDAAPSPSLRGSRSLADGIENVTAAATVAPAAASASAREAHAEEADTVTGASGDTTPEGGEPEKRVPGLAAAGADGSDLAAADLAALMDVARTLAGGNVSEDGVEALLLMSGGWHQGGDKLWGSGAGVESITSGNVGYYDGGMNAAHSRCGGAGCALIVNPPGHRSVHHFHIHFVHYHSYGADLKRRLESKVCGRSGWQEGGLPCGGKAAYFPGFPGVFSKAMTGGGLHHASVIAWPASCGGGGTIVELAYSCSIEHQIRGDYNPRYR